MDVTTKAMVVLTKAQQVIIAAAIENGGWLELNGAAKIVTGRRLEALGLGKMRSGFTDSNGVRRRVGRVGEFFVLTEVFANSENV